MPRINKTIASILNIIMTPPAKKKSQHANVMLATINMYTVVDLTNKVTVVYLGKQILMSSVTTEKNVVEGQN